MQIDSSSSKQIERINALSNVCRAQIELLNAHIDVTETKGAKYRGKMKVLAAKMKGSIVMLR